MIAGLFIVFVFVCTASGAGCNSKTPIRGPTNDYPVLDLSKLDPSHVKLFQTVDNGKVFQVTVPNDNGTTSSTFFLTHVYGNYYQMGLAQGKLLGPQIVAFIENTWDYFKTQIDGVLPNYFPLWLKDMIATIGLDAALDLTELATFEYTDSKIFQELQGIADGSGVDYKTALRVHMIAGLTQGKCSMLGIWGAALDPSYKSSLLQLRALDWDMNGPFRDNSAITVYHPTDGTNAHVNIGMVGFIGGLTGVSAAQLGISEIGVSYPDDVFFGSESRIGVPFIFLLRDILRYDQTVDDTTSRMAMAKRTCDLILGVGDGKLNEFKGYAYSSSQLHVFDDKNLQPFNETWHPRITDVVYWGMDWLCPAYNTVLSEQIKQWYGKITPEIAIKYLTAVEMSGDNHLAFYDLTRLHFWVSFAAPKSTTGKVPAYARQFAKFDANVLLNQKYEDL